MPEADTLDVIGIGQYYPKSGYCFNMKSILQGSFTGKLKFLAATKQLYEWFSPSVTPFLLCSHHLIIMKLSGVITNYRKDVHAKGQGQRF